LSATVSDVAIAASAVSSGVAESSGVEVSVIVSSRLSARLFFLSLFCFGGFEAFGGFGAAGGFSATSER